MRGTISKNAKVWDGRCPRRVTIIISAFQWQEKPTGTREKIEMWWWRENNRNVVAVVVVVVVEGK